MLSPHFLVRPPASGASMGMMLQVYLTRCQECAKEPDTELLPPLLPFLSPPEPDEAEAGEGTE